MMDFDTGRIRVLHGNVLDRIADIATESIDCVATSPPYYLARHYPGTEAVWAMTKPQTECPHPEWFLIPPPRIRYAGDAGEGSKQEGNGSAQYTIPATHGCEECGAWKGSLGMEPTPEMFVEHLTHVFAKVARTLTPTGTMFVVMGDSYVGDPKGYGPGHKKKDLLLIPSALGMSLKRSGWWLRNKIIWHKNMVFPSPVDDRFTNCYEEVLFLSKGYDSHLDIKAVSQPVSEAMMKAAKKGARADRVFKHDTATTLGKRSGNRVFSDQGAMDKIVDEGRRLRDVWSINPEPRADLDHVAMFPTRLVDGMVRAGCPPGGTVLDPFAGSGTTLEVAFDLGRRSVGIEMSADNIANIHRRLSHRAVSEEAATFL